MNDKNKTRLIGYARGSTNGPAEPAALKIALYRTYPNRHAQHPRPRSFKIQSLALCRPPVTLPPLMDLPNRTNQLEVVAPLSRSEQRALERAERTIARGLKAFVTVGAALKEIRDKRLYRADYENFETYCACRWQMSRPRAYQLCSAAEVIRALSTKVDSNLLPEHETHVRPLTRLKEPEQWRQAWRTAVKTAADEGRRVTARDAEEAVNRLNGKASLQLPWANGEPVYNCIVGDNSDLIRAVARLYFKKGDRIADLTYGKGVFWRQVNLADYVFYKSDKITCPATPHDFRRLPYKDSFFNAVVLDPPYAHHGDGMLIEANYLNASTTGGLYHKQIIDLYKQGMTEAKRALKAGGLLLVKCADEIESSKQMRGHIEVYEIVMELGLEDQDLFVLMRPNAPVVQFKNQHHARKNCSFLWIFRKPLK